MKILVVATEKQKHEIISHKIADSIVGFHFVKNIQESQNYEDFDAYFLLTGNIAEIDFNRHSGKPVIVDSVVDTLKSMNLPSNFCRINAWPGFLQRPVYEVAATDETKTATLFRELGWNILFVKDEPGLVAARVISMIINEAYFAMGEDISSIEGIDTAMKLGTNYPIGPFEWGARIGINNVHMLLEKLSVTEKRYLIAPALEQEFKNFNATLTS